MDLHCQQAYSESVQSSEIANPNMQTLVAEDDGGLVGYAQVRWMDVPACVEARSPGEVYRLYVSRAWHGKGVARSLMTECLNAIAQRGCEIAWLGVWEHNPRAIAFLPEVRFPRSLATTCSWLCRSAARSVMSRQLTAAGPRWRIRTPSMSQPPVVIGVAGGSGSGKSTVVRRIAQSLGPERVTVLEHDRYYNDRKELRLEERAQLNYDHPDSLETDLLVEHVRSLVNGESVEIPNYDFTMHARRTTTERVEPGSSHQSWKASSFTRTRHCAI